MQIRFSICYIFHFLSYSLVGARTLFSHVRQSYCCTAVYDQHLLWWCDIFFSSWLPSYDFHLRWQPGACHHCQRQELIKLLSYDVWKHWSQMRHYTYRIITKILPRVLPTGYRHKKMPCLAPVRSRFGNTNMDINYTKNLIKIASANVWVKYFVWNFKGYLLKFHMKYLYPYIEIYVYIIRWICKSSWNWELMRVFETSPGLFAGALEYIIRWRNIPHVNNRLSRSHCLLPLSCQDISNCNNGKFATSLNKYYVFGKINSLPITRFWYTLRPVTYMRWEIQGSVRTLYYHLNQHVTWLTDHYIKC